MLRVYKALRPVLYLISEYGGVVFWTLTVAFITAVSILWIGWYWLVIPLGIGVILSIVLALDNYYYIVYEKVMTATTKGGEDESE